MKFIQFFMVKLEFKIFFLNVIQAVFNLMQWINFVEEICKGEKKSCS